MHDSGANIIDEIISSNSQTNKQANKNEIMATWRVHMYASQSSSMESGHNFQFIFFLGIKLWNI